MATEFTGNGYIEAIKAIKSGVSREQDQLKHAVEILSADMSQDIKRQILIGRQPSQIDKSTAFLINVQTFKLLQALNDRNMLPEDKIKAIENYHVACLRLARRYDWIKIIATVTSAALGFVIGATVGAAIGMLAGVWAGPGAAFSSLVGVWLGAKSGAAIGVTAAAFVTSATSTFLAGLTLFSYNRLLKNDVGDVAKNAIRLNNIAIL